MPHETTALQPLSKNCQSCRTWTRLLTDLLQRQRDACHEMTVPVTITINRWSARLSQSRSAPRNF